MYVIHEGIADSDAGTTALTDAEYTLGEEVAFDPESGRARVRRDVGESLIEHYDDVVAADEADDDDPDEDSDS